MPFSDGNFYASAGFFPPFLSQMEIVQQQIDWFGTVRGRAGWLATPNLLLFGTGGFAYGRVSDSVNWGEVAAPGFSFSQAAALNGFGLSCGAGPPLPASNTCFAGSSSGVRTGWSAGGGLEWLLDQHWSAKIEYQFVDLGTHTVTLVNIPSSGLPPGITLSTFNAVIHDSFNVVRPGLNYRF